MTTLLLEVCLEVQTDIGGKIQQNTAIGKQTIVLKGGQKSHITQLTGYSRANKS